MTRLCSLAIAWALLSACGGTEKSEAKSPAAVPVPSPATVAPVASAQPSEDTKPYEPTTEEAHRLAVATLGCWLGGVWSDAQGVPTDARAAEAEHRCQDLVARVYGKDDKARYERLRAVEAEEVLALKDKILAVARGDSVDAGRQAELGTFIDASANVERETMNARRAADRVKKDIDETRESGKRATDVEAFPVALGESKAFETLLDLDLGDLTHEARAVALLAALDRMEIARGLPKPLGVFVLGRLHQALFGVAPPEVPKNPAAAMKGGAWLAYLKSVARAAGHPVPDDVKSLADQELLAWGGALAGLADRLRSEADGISDATELKRASIAVVARLENDYRDLQAAVEHEPEPPMPPRRLGKPSR